MERAGLSHALRAWRGREPFDSAQGRPFDSARGRQGAAGSEPILIAESEPARFMTAFADAVAGEADLFLCDPNWGASEKEQLAAILKSKTKNQNSKIDTGWLMIPTGGSSGSLKFARHDQDTVAAAVDGFVRHFSLARVNAMGVLPLHHVGGLMAWLRCALTGGEYRPLDWRGVEQGNLPAVDGDWTISLVPTQLERLMRQPAAVDWLRRFAVVFLGGAPAWPDLLERAAGAGVRLSLGYGMTETAAMATALLPGEFLAGERTSGRPLPHAQVALDPDGVIVLSGGSLFRGYYPAWRAEPAFVTNDLGRIDGSGNLEVLGRRDGMIISGGEKILPAEVEAMLRATGEFDDVVVVGVPDPEWGQAVVAAYPATRQPDLAKVRLGLEATLAPHKRPKHYMVLGDWTRSGAGKVDRADVTRRAENFLRQGGDSRNQ
jgi:O-succinylbenzoic acid--CoA ligase